MSSQNNTTLYIGVTNDLERRVKEHKSGEIPGFTQKYKCCKLVYFEEYSDIDQAIEREKKLKKWIIIFAIVIVINIIIILYSFKIVSISISLLESSCIGILEGFSTTRR